MITIKTDIVPDTYSEKGGINYRASCTVKDIKSEAFSRSCPVQALCRVLVAARVKDQAAEVVSSGLNMVTMRHSSIYSEAGWTYGESSIMSVRRGKFVDPATRVGVSI